MFNIVENNFCKNGIVKYKDENENRLMIIADKTGKELKIKFRPNNKNIKFDTIKIEYPYEVDGLSFTPHFTQELADYIHSNEMMDILKQIIEIAQRWVIISRDLVILTAPTEQLNIDDKQLESLTYDIISELTLYNETLEFITMYKVMLSQLNKKGGMKANA